MDKDKKMRNKGMLSMEYAFLIVAILAALLSMFVYLQRSICGKWRESADTFGYGRQYQP